MADLRDTSNTTRVSFGNTRDKRDVRYRRATFTCFESSEPLWNSDKMVVLIYQREECPDTSKPHWQGYVEFKNQTERKTCQKFLGIGKSHMESAKGSREDNYCYCNSKGKYANKPNLGNQVCKGYDPENIMWLTHEEAKKNAIQECILDDMVLCKGCDGAHWEESCFETPMRWYCFKCRALSKHLPDV